MRGRQEEEEDKKNSQREQYGILFLNLYIHGGGTKYPRTQSCRCTVPTATRATDTGLGGCGAPRWALEEAETKTIGIM